MRTDRSSVMDQIMMYNRIRASPHCDTLFSGLLNRSHSQNETSSAISTLNPNEAIVQQEYNQVSSSQNTPMTPSIREIEKPAMPTPSLDDEVPYRILIRLRFKRLEEWNELYDRFMVFSRQWRLDSIMGVLEYIIDSSLSKPVVVKVPASHFQAGDKPFEQMLDLQFETEARHKEFQNKWLQFQKKFAAYDNAMAFTLGMDLLFGVIPIHFLEFYDERSIPTGHQVVCQSSYETNPIDLSDTGNRSPAQSVVSLEAIDLSCSNQTSKISDITSQSTGRITRFLTEANVDHPASVTFSEANSNLSQKGSPISSKSSPNEGKDHEDHRSRRKSTPQKKKLIIQNGSSGHDTKQSFSGPGSDSGFLTDPEGNSSVNGDEVTTYSHGVSADSLTNFLVQDLHVVRDLADTVEFHRRGHNCFVPLTVNNVCFKNNALEFNLQCSQKHAYQIDFFYEMVEGNCHVFG